MQEAIPTPEPKPNGGGSCEFCDRPASAAVEILTMTGAPSGRFVSLVQEPNLHVQGPAAGAGIERGSPWLTSSQHGS